MTLICVDLEKILGPSKLPKQPKPPRIKREPKPPRALTRVPGLEKNVAIGMKLLALRATIKGNCAFGRAVRRQFDIDAQDAAEMMKVARVYGSRPEIFTRLSWVALVTLSSPALPAAAREALESRIRAGEAIGAPEIRAARGTQARTAQASRSAGDADGSLSATARPTCHTRELASELCFRGKWLGTPRRPAPKSKIQFNGFGELRTYIRQTHSELADGTAENHIHRSHARRCCGARHRQCRGARSGPS
jgi:hypothetical protein